MRESRHKRNQICKLILSPNPDGRENQDQKKAKTKRACNFYYCAMISIIVSHVTSKTHTPPVLWYVMWLWYDH